MHNETIKAVLKSSYISARAAQIRVGGKCDQQWNYFQGRKQLVEELYFILFEEKIEEVLKNAAV